MLPTKYVESLSLSLRDQWVAVEGCCVADPRANQFEFASGIWAETVSWVKAPSQFRIRCGGRSIVRWSIPNVCPWSDRSMVNRPIVNRPMVHRPMVDGCCTGLGNPPQRAKPPAAGGDLCYSARLRFGDQIPLGKMCARYARAITVRSGAA